MTCDGEITFDGTQPLIEHNFDGILHFMEPLMEDDFWWKGTFDRGQLLMEDILWLQSQSCKNLSKILRLNEVWHWSLVKIIFS